MGSQGVVAAHYSRLHKSMEKNYHNKNQLQQQSANSTLINLPLDLHSVLIGLMLGDGSLSRSSPTSNARLEMSFGQKYEEFALHLGNLFKDYMKNPVKSLEVKGKIKTYKNFRLKKKVYLYLLTIMIYFTSIIMN